jgi:hypothetical protein
MNGRAGADRRGRKHARGDYLASPLAPESNRMEARRIAVRKREDWDSATRPPAVRAENELGFVWGALLLVGGVESMAEASETREGLGIAFPVVTSRRAASRSLASTWARRRF